MTTTQRSFPVPALALATALVIAVVLQITGGWPHLAGFGLGVGGGLISVMGTWAGLHGAGLAIGESANRRAVIALLLAFMVKLPLVFGTGLLSYRIGHGAIPCFLGGLMLVYFALFWWALLRK